MCVKKSRSRRFFDPLHGFRERRAIKIACYKLRCRACRKFAVTIRVFLEFDAFAKHETLLEFMCCSLALYCYASSGLFVYLCYFGWHVTLSFLLHPKLLLPVLFRDFTMKLYDIIMLPLLPPKKDTLCLSK